ncbi:MAG: ribbon-helix-helix protein, CopG family [Bryobacterales bacterium]|nr:ribbon-helix-helix protein, CopG family [Bryobacterales bacterium]
MSTSITLPPTMLREVEQLARREGKTVSDLLQEAVRRYLTQAQLRELQVYGREQSERLGLAEEDVERLIHEYRREAREVQPQ